MFGKLFSKNAKSSWAFEAIDRKGKVVAILPSIPMAERKVKEIGGGTIRPVKSTPDEVADIRKKAAKRRKGIGIRTKPGKSAERPAISRVSGTMLIRATGQRIRDFAEVHCALGGNLPLVQNPAIVMEESRMAAYRCDNPLLGLDLFSKVMDPKQLMGSNDRLRKVIDSTDLKKVAKNLDPKQTYDVVFLGDRLHIGNERYGWNLEVKEDSVFNDPFRIDLDVYCWATTARFHKTVKEITKSCAYATIAMERDGFVHLYGEDDDGKPVMKTAIGTGEGYSAHTCKATFNSKMLLKVATMFKKAGEVKIEIEEDYPVKFTFEIEGRKYEAMIAPRIGA